MNLSSEDLAAIEAVVVKVLDAKFAVIAGEDPAPAIIATATSLPVREVQPGDVEELATKIRAAFPDATPASAWLEPFLLYRQVDDAFTYISDAIRTFGGWYELGKFHSMYQTLAFRAMTPGPFVYVAPEPLPGYVGETKDPAEILARAELGQSWAGDAPVGPFGLGQRAETFRNLQAKEPGAAPEWYEASADAAKVLVCGNGFDPFAHGLQSGDAYPCPGVYDLAGVCAALTGGGKPGGF